MAQNPLPPPPPSGGVLDGWLYMLWRRLTQAGQILWESITPGTSADVAAAVTDETGSPGSLVFSANPTLVGCYINGIFYQGATSSISGQTILSGVFSTDTASGTVLAIRKSCSAINGPNFIFSKSRGSAASPSVVSADDAMGAVACSAFDGENYTQGTQIISYVDGAVSSGVVPGRIVFNTFNSSGAGVEAMRITSGQVITLGGSSTASALKIIPDATPSTQRRVEITAGSSTGNPTIGVSGGILAISSSVAITGVVSTSGYTVATLPAGTVGQRTYVTDALAPAYGAAVAGGGAVTAPVFYNGAAWICA